jgi:hypothetical protein
VTGSVASDTATSTNLPVPPPGASVSLLADAPVYLFPDSNRTPLRELPKGASLTFLEATGGWYHITFHDSQWGTRHGYVEARLVQPPPEPLDLSIQRPAAKQRPLDLSVPPHRTAPQAPVDVSITKSSAVPSNGTSNREPLDLSIQPTSREPADLSVPRSPSQHPVDLSVQTNNR